MADYARIARLAKQIDEDLKKDVHLRLTEADVTQLRREGAFELHAICADFVAEVNRRLTTPRLELTPSEYTSHMFRERGVNLVQVNAQGRIIQIAFEATRGYLGGHPKPAIGGHLKSGQRDSGTRH